jgi:hypothetical protein
MGTTSAGFFKNRDFETRVTEIITPSLLETSIPKDFADYLSVFLSFNNPVSQVET